MRVLVIGAGIFGTTAALKLSKEHDVTLVDVNNDIMLNASKCNHSRLHFGFHYPRSVETAQQSIDGYGSFYQSFRSAIRNDFPNYYMIENGSKVTPAEYEIFCSNLQLYFREEYPNIDMDFSKIRSSFLTNEPIFDYDILKSILKKMLDNSTITVILNKGIKRKSDMDEYDVIINTSYFNINEINKLFNIKQQELKLQTVVIPIFKKKMSRIGLTIMDGEYCSIMPKGFEKDHFLLYHVKESVIYETIGYTIPTIWRYGKRIIKNNFIKKYIYDKFIVNKYIDRIFKESQKYYTFLENCERVGYWQTVRALPINEDDCRLSDIRYDEVEGKKIISVLSGKLTTCWTIAEDIKNMI